MQHDPVLKKLYFDLLTPSRGLGCGRGRGLLAKYFLPCCCISDSLKFDMQHDHVLKKLNFDLLTPTRGRELGWGLGAKYFLPCFRIRDSLSFDMQHYLVLKKLNFDLLTPQPKSTKWVRHRPWIGNCVGYISYLMSPCLHAKFSKKKYNLLLLRTLNI